MNTLALDHVNKRAEFVMSFTIPFKAGIFWETDVQAGQKHDCCNQQECRKD